mgnify:FL=1
MQGQRDQRGRFLPGHANCGGRPKGGRNRLAESFFQDLNEVWQKRGRIALEKLVEQDPVTFARLIGSLMPKQAASAILVGTQIAELNKPTVEVSLVGIDRN